MWKKYKKQILIFQNLSRDKSIIVKLIFRFQYKYVLAILRFDFIKRFLVMEENWLIHNPRNNL